jgi:Maltose operon periplasmic protein precursor (MalM)
MKFQAGVVIKFAIVICLLPFVLIGCRTSASKAAEIAEFQRFNAAIVKGYESVQAIPITFDKSGYAMAYIDHAATAPTYAFKNSEGANQLVQTFRLPPWTATYEIQLTSFALGGLAEPSLYYPKLIFLDSDFKPTRQSKLADYVFRNVGSQGGISATFFMNDTNQKETYVAILNETAKSFEEQLSILQTSSTMTYAVPVRGGSLFFAFTSSGNEPPKKMRASDTGYLELKFTRK